MDNFWYAIIHYSFMRNAIITGVLASIACGVIGSYVVTRRLTYIAGGIAHCILGGMGLARYLNIVHNWQALHPLYGAIIAALLAAITIGLVSLYARQREDTVISALWAVGMAIGIIFISKTPGYNQDLMNYLFGNILMVTKSNLWLMASLDFLVVVIGLLFYQQLLAVCFDEEYARIRGVRVKFYYLLLLCLAAITVVLLVTVVGIIMVIALLTLPVAIAGLFSRTLLQMMLLATLISIFFSFTGLAISYQPDLPAGATIILLAGIIYLLALIIKNVFPDRIRKPRGKNC